MLKNCGKAFEYAVEWGVDLQTEHERYLTEEIFKKPVFVTDYPKDIKAFYMRLNDDGKTVAATDCLVPGIGEIIGGSQREERLDVLKARMAELGLNEEDYWWYLELRKYGETKHAGFGLGFERLIMYITGMSNIRDVIPFQELLGCSRFSQYIRELLFFLMQFLIFSKSMCIELLIFVHNYNVKYKPVIYRFPSPLWVQALCAFLFIENKDVSYHKT